MDTETTRPHRFLMTIEFYQANADAFFNDTVGVDMQSLYEPFVAALPANARILDAGCGSGRDSKAFLDMGFNVEAFDASSEMVQRASAYTGLSVSLCSFADFAKPNHFDAIWACASLLHVAETELPAAMSSLNKALKNGGIWYMSFKYGDGERVKDGRTFTDMNEDRFSSLISQFPHLAIHQLWLTEDKRPDRSERWLNIIVIKNH